MPQSGRGVAQHSIACSSGLIIFIPLLSRIASRRLFKTVRGNRGRRRHRLSRSTRRALPFRNLLRRVALHRKRKPVPSPHDRLRRDLLRSSRHGGRGCDEMLQEGHALRPTARYEL